MVQSLFEYVQAQKVALPPEVDPRFDAPPVVAAAPLGLDDD